MIPFIDLEAQQRRLGPRLEARIRAVLGHGRFILGPEVGELEAELSAFAGCAEAVGVSSGTDALLIALMAEGIGPGDAVFVPAFTFTATAEVVAAAGAEPVFVDVDPGTRTMDAEDLERRVAAVGEAGRLKPRAVIAVDLFGLPADYGILRDIAGRNGMFLLADAAQSFGARQDGRRVGRLAPVTATSFYPTKPLGCYGDGGALLTDDGERAARYRSIRHHGAGADADEVARLGMNGRLDTLQAAVLLAKLEVFEEELAARRRVAAAYDRLLGNAVGLPARPAGAESAWAVYAVLVEDRDRVRRALDEAGIQTRVYYPRPLHLQPAFAAHGEGPGSRPVSEDLCRRILALPMHPYMDEAAVRRVAEAVVKAVRGMARRA